jgi:hypothetical protein
MERWQNKIWHLRQFLRGWARDLSGHYKIEKERLSIIIDIIDKKAEICPISDNERMSMRQANDELAKLRRNEE